MDRLEAMSFLVAVMETGSFSAASRQLGVPLPTLSRRVAELEAALGAKLMVRSTRKLTLTEAGAGYLDRCRQILEQVGEAERAVSGEYRTPSGNLVITAPIVFGRLHLLPVIDDFLAAFPRVRVRLRLADGMLHLVENHIDVALRIAVLPDSSLVASTVGTVCRVIAASPRYLAGHGTPRVLDDLLSHSCVTFEGVNPLTGWAFTPKGSSATTVPIQPRLSVDTAEAAIDAAIAGVGLTQVLSYQVAQAVEQGKLTLVLREFEPEPVPVSLVHTGLTPMPGKIRSFLDFAVPRLRASLAHDKERLKPR
jgi:DNA-binding transcriptional LysR family regulator